MERGNVLREEDWQKLSGGTPPQEAVITLTEGSSRYHSVPDLGIVSEGNRLMSQILKSCWIV